MSNIKRLALLFIDLLLWFTCDLLELGGGVKMIVASAFVPLLIYLALGVMFCDCHTGIVRDVPPRK
jgi:hypothetical protein